MSSSSFLIIPLTYIDRNKDGGWVRMGGVSGLSSCQRLKPALFPGVCRHGLKRLWKNAIEGLGRAGLKPRRADALTTNS